MSNLYPDALPPHWEDRIESFESRRRRDRAADLAEYLPPRCHPLYLRVLVELIRIDLEFHWKNGQARWIEDFQRDFPELFEDASALRAVAFEEYRLRRQAGEEPTPAEYQDRIGAPIGFWPRPRTSDAGRAPIATR
jgi:hypothetical protein